MGLENLGHTKHQTGEPIFGKFKWLSELDILGK